jgi:hypothetical protein
MEVVANLETIEGTIVPLPTSETQVRSLTSLEPEQQREVWIEAAATTAPGGKITGAHVEKVKEAKARSWSAPETSSGTKRQSRSSDDMRWAKQIAGCLNRTIGLIERRETETDDPWSDKAMDTISQPLTRLVEVVESKRKR